MLITVTTTSANLLDLLNTASVSDKALVLLRTGSCRPDGKYKVFLQNLGLNDIYLEFYKDATTTDSVKIVASTGEISLGMAGLEKINLVSNSGNSNVRLLINY